MSRELVIDFDMVFHPKRRVFFHFLFWILYLVYFTIAFASFRDNYLQSFTEVAVTLPVRLAAAYLTLYWLIPGFLDKERYLPLIFLSILSAIAFGYMDRILLHLFYVPRYIPDYDYASYPLTSISKAIQRTTSIYTVVFAAAAIKLIKRNYHNERVTREMAKEKLDAELQFLKAQIHPHFLFNTLNSLYSLTLRKSDQSAEVVLKLSQFLDYMLYDCNVREIALPKELEQIQNLVSLEKLRYGERLDIHFQVHGPVQEYRVPPLLMLPFLENAFKHGVSQQSENSFIFIDLKVKGEDLTFRIENSSSGPGEVRELDYTKGIGLKNVKRRLDLLYTPNGYHLEMFSEEDSFTIILHLKLKPIP